MLTRKDVSEGRTLFSFVNSEGRAAHFQMLYLIYQGLVPTLQYNVNRTASFSLNEFTREVAQMITESMSPSARKSLGKTDKTVTDLIYGELRPQAESLTKSAVELLEWNKAATVALGIQRERVLGMRLSTLKSALRYQRI